MSTFPTFRLFTNNHYSIVSLFVVVVKNVGIMSMRKFNYNSSTGPLFKCNGCCKIYSQMTRIYSFILLNKTHVKCIYFTSQEGKQREREGERKSFSTMWNFFQHWRSRTEFILFVAIFKYFLYIWEKIIDHNSCFRSSNRVIKELLLHDDNKMN